MITVDPLSDRTWLQSEPKVWTDGAHAVVEIGPNSQSDDAMSEAVKRLKPRLLQASGPFRSPSVSQICYSRLLLWIGRPSLLSLSPSER